MCRRGRNHPRHVPRHTGAFMGPSSAQIVHSMTTRFRFWRSLEQWATIYKVSLCGIFWPNGAKGGKGVGAKRNMRECSLVGSVGLLCYIFISFRLLCKALFLSAWVRIPPKLHFNYVRSSVAVHCSIGQNIRHCPTVHRGPFAPLSAKNAENQCHIERKSWMIRQLLSPKSKRHFVGKLNFAARFLHRGRT